MERTDNDQTPAPELQITPVSNESDEDLVERMIELGEMPGPNAWTSTNSIKRYGPN